MAKLSIISVTYNNQETIEEFLSSVLKALPKDSEVIVVDSGSDDKTAQIIKKEKRVTFIESKENVGFGKGSDIGAKKADGDYLLFLNPDTKVLDDSIKKILDFADDGREFGIIAPALYEKEGKPQPSVRKLPTVTGAVKEYLLGVKNAYEPYAPIDEGVAEVEAVVGAAMLIRKNLFDEIGGFDAKYFMYFEDLDLCRRVRKLGFSVIYFPEARFIHRVGGSINPLKTKWIKESEKKYHGSFNFTVLSLVYFLVRIKNRIFKAS